MKVIKIGTKIIKFWCDQTDLYKGDVMRQIENVCKLPFLHKHPALMPDAHSGYGVPIGGVFGAVNTIVPNAVGKDIGCGMCAYRTDLIAKDVFDDINVLKSVMSRVRELIPLGKNWNKQSQNLKKTTNDYSTFVPRQELEAASRQLGSLGGGNHFIEFQFDESGYLWFMIHSGSRNVGNRTATYHDSIARKINEKYHSSVDVRWQLSFLPADSDEGQQYINDMNWCLDFAKQNRKLMMEKTIQAFNDVTGLIPNAKLNDILDVHHNYAQLENHFNKNVWVHRKGATRAYKGELGIIPGSQGTNSYIVEGLGNKESFKSCSHGAGRAMGRGEAKAKLDYSQELDKLAGLVHTVRSRAELDESVGSYKDIQTVMRNQKDLVKIVTTLTPMGCIKG